jgi:hypothetical protein
MRVTIDVNFSKFHKKCEATISKVAGSTYAATEEACEDIMKESLRQVPRDTETLANSAFYNIQEAKDYGYEAILGYGGSAINPKTGVPVMDYAVAVHEDLEAVHPIGKAKFLEDPIRDYASEKFPRTVIKHVGPTLESENNE